MVLVFWLSCAVVAYVYAGYPLLIATWARLRPRPLQIQGGPKGPPLRTTALPHSPAGTRPGVSIVIAARNEARRLPDRLANLFQQDYPSDRVQIIVVSDGSTDDTMCRLAAYPHVDAIAVPAGGKALALNAGVERARFDILVFADARQTFASDALLELTRPFGDPRVGAVTGELVLDSESGRRTATADRRFVDLSHGFDRRTGTDRRVANGSTIADGVGLYWRFEKQLRRLESAVASTLGATGAIYAMRRSLWKPLPADTILDDVLAPMRTVLAGYRIVCNPRAQAFDRTSRDAQAESRRKVRTLAGNYQILWLEPRLLLPWRNRVWVQYLSHKVGRLIVPYALLMLYVASIMLADRSPFYAAVLAGQCLFYLLAGYGAWLDSHGVVATARAEDGAPASWTPAPTQAQTPRGARV
jgi:biofilm PGA synthesis N-glycosyltransferase PgaC